MRGKPFKPCRFPLGNVLLLLKKWLFIQWCSLQACKAMQSLSCLFLLFLIASHLHTVCRVDIMSSRHRTDCQQEVGPWAQFFLHMGRRSNLEVSRIRGLSSIRTITLQVTQAILRSKGTGKTHREYLPENLSYRPHLSHVFCRGGGVNNILFYFFFYNFLQVTDFLLGSKWLRGDLIALSTTTWKDVAAWWMLISFLRWQNARKWSQVDREEI